MVSPMHTTCERDCLRRLADRKQHLAETPENRDRLARWQAFDAEDAPRAMVLFETGGVLDELLPVAALQCRDPWARGQERRLRREIFQFEQVRDDSVIDPAIHFNWRVEKSDYGVATVQHRADNEGRLGARRWDPPIADLDRDFGKLRPRTFRVDRDATQAEEERLRACFGDILPVERRGSFWWTMGMTIVAIDLIGLERLMLAPYDQPDGLHRLMRFLCDDHLAFARWLEREGLLSLNNGNDYIGSGSRGFTRRLPQPDWRPGQPVRLRDLWVLLESQETVGVGPEQFESFIFPYQRDVAEAFCRCYYGCCEPVHSRMNAIRRLPGLARVSVSPWADEAAMAAWCGRELVYSRKPNPALISTAVFDEAAIRRDLRQTLETARGCRIELIMKDVHTLNSEPDRAGRWVALAREEIRRAGLD